MTERFTEKVNDRNMVRNGIYGTIGTHGRYFVGEAIDKLAEYETAEEEITKKLDKIKEHLFSLGYTENLEEGEMFDIIIEVIKELKEYRRTGTVKEFKEMDLIISKVERNELPRIINEWIQYSKVGTVEWCREAVEKQIQKKCAIDSCPDHTHYKCPSCGQIELSIYKHGFPRLGRITKYCENCGQALQQEDI